MAAGCPSSDDDVSMGDVSMADAESTDSDEPSIPKQPQTQEEARHAEEEPCAIPQENACPSSASDQSMDMADSSEDDGVKADLADEVDLFGPPTLETCGRGTNSGVDSDRGVSNKAIVSADVEAVCAMVAVSTEQLLAKAKLQQEARRPWRANARADPLPMQVLETIQPTNTAKQARKGNGKRTFHGGPLVQNPLSQNFAPSPQLDLPERPHIGWFCAGDEVQVLDPKYRGLRANVRGMVKKMVDIVIQSTGMRMLIEKKYVKVIDLPAETRIANTARGGKVGTAEHGSGQGVAAECRAKNGIARKLSKPAARKPAPCATGTLETQSGVAADAPSEHSLEAQLVSTESSIALADNELEDDLLNALDRAFADERQVEVETQASSSSKPATARRGREKTTEKFGASAAWMKMCDQIGKAVGEDEPEPVKIQEAERPKSAAAKRLAARRAAAPPKPSKKRGRILQSESLTNLYRGVTKAKNAIEAVDLLKEPVKIPEEKRLEVAKQSAQKNSENKEALRECRTTWLKQTGTTGLMSSASDCSLPSWARDVLVSEGAFG